LKLHWSIIFILILSTLVYSQASVKRTNQIFQGEKFVFAEGININSLGDFKESWKSGSGFQVGYGIIYSDQGSLVFQTGYMNFKAKDDGGIEDGGTFTAIPLQVGGRYYITLDRFRPFLLAMNGINIIQQDWVSADTSLSKKSWQYNFQVGIGLDVILFSDLQVELAAKYNSHLLEPTIPYNITGLEYSIGLVWRLSPAIKN
jgi:hypothetical protein